MPWNYDDAQINGIIDGGIKDAPPAAPMSNTAGTVRALLKAMWLGIRTQVAKAVTDIEAANAGLVARSLSIQMTINMRGDGDDTRTGADNGNTATGAIKTLTRAAALASGKCQSLSIIINPGAAVTLDTDVSFDVPEMFIHVKTGGALTIKNRVIKDGNQIVVGEGNWRLIFQSNNANIRVEGTITVEGGTGSSGAGDQFYYKWYQGAFTIATAAFMRAGNRFQALNFFVINGTVSVGTNAYFANYGGAGLNSIEGAPSLQAMYNRNQSGGSFALAAGAVESTLVGDRQIFRTYTPVSSTDANVSEREMVADANFIYRKQGGVIKKVALTTF